MPKEENRQRLKEWKAQQRDKAEQELPAPKETLLTLFDELDRRLGDVSCDHSLKLTRSWASDRKLDWREFEAWLHNNGGHCDCEVLANVQDSNDALRVSLLPDTR